VAVNEALSVSVTEMLMKIDFNIMMKNIIVLIVKKSELASPSNLTLFINLPLRW